MAYFLIEGYRIQSLAGRRGIAISELVASSGWFLRRGFLWVLIVLATLYTLLIAGNILVTVLAFAHLYVAGLFAQAAQAVEDDRGPEDERRPRDDQRSSESQFADG